jgi:hypothetical protein
VAEPLVSSGGTRYPPMVPPPASNELVQMTMAVKPRAMACTREQTRAMFGRSERIRGQLTTWDCDLP